MDSFQTSCPHLRPSPPSRNFSQVLQPQISYCNKNLDLFQRNLINSTYQILDLKRDKTALISGKTRTKRELSNLAWQIQKTWVLTLLFFITSDTQLYLERTI